MKKSHGSIVMGTSLLLAAANSQGQLADNFYVDVGAGPAFQQDSTLNTSPYSTTKINFDTGVRATVAVGYNVCKSCAVELETGVIWNAVDSLGGNTLSRDSANADLYQIPLMANVIYKVPLKGAFKPYIGAGVGAAVGIFSGSNVPLLYYPVPGSSTDYNSTDIAFAYQAEIGCKYELCKHMELGLAYKFLGTPGYDWSANDTPLKTDSTMTHAVMITFDWRF